MPKDPTPTSRNGSQSAAPGAAKPGAAQQAPQLRVLAQYVKDLSFESPNAPQALRDPGDNPNIQVEVNIATTSIEANVYECAIDFKVKAASAKMVIYNIEMVYAGAFELQNMPPEMLQPVLVVNCPAILFPFLRRLVGDLTREGGFPPLWLDPIDWGALYQQKMTQSQPGKPGA